MSCRHDQANGTCTRCYSSNPCSRRDEDRIDPDPGSGASGAVGMDAGRSDAVEEKRR